MEIYYGRYYGDPNLKDQLKKICKPQNFFYEWRNSVCKRCPDRVECQGRKET